MLSFFLALIDEEEQKEKFVILYERYCSLMLNVAYRYLNDRSLAEDAVQDAFLAIAKNIKKVGDPDSAEARAYLLTVTRGCAIRLYHKFENETPDGDAVNEKIKTAAPSAESEFIAYSDAAELKQAVKDLPDIYREPLLLRVAYGYSYKQIAKIVGLSEQGCRKRVERAKKMLGL
jgi:RNA polymerase sigma-70 factor (ECF subfamily)